MGVPPQHERASALGTSFKDYYQAGKSVSGITRVQSVAEVVQEYAAATTAHGRV